jgi:FkbM family methyltransferase
MINRILQKIRYERSYLKTWHEMQAGKRKYVDYSMLSNLKLRLYPDSYLSYLILREDFEIAEQQFLLKVLQPGDIFVDIGANIGFFSIQAAKLVGEQGKVLAFEPTPKTYNRLNENIDLNNFNNIITPFQIAIGNRKETLPMNISGDQFDAWNTLGNPSVEGKFSQIQVPVETFAFILNQMTKTDKLKLKLIKIDVEGFEIKVFNGIFPILKEIPGCYWMIEFNDENFIPNGYTGKELATELKQHGFELFSIQDDGSLNEMQEIPEHFSYMNIVARNK